MLVKVFGIIFTILGVAVSLYTTFLYLNSSAYLDYNKPTLGLGQVGLVIPIITAVLLLIAGLSLIILPKDKAY